MDRIADEVLSDDFKSTLSGTSKHFVESSSSLMFAFMLALVFIYLVLAAQFESFRDPLIIMFTVPLALIGAMVAFVVFWADHEHFQPDWYHHVGRDWFRRTVS